MSQINGIPVNNAQRRPFPVVVHSAMALYLNPYYPKGNPNETPP